MLSKLADVGILVLVGIAAFMFFTRPAKPEPPPPPYAVDEVITELTSPIEQTTLVVAISTQCGFCEASIPVHQALIKAAKTAGVKVVVLMSEDPAVGAAHLEANDMVGDSLLSAKDLGLTRIRSVPTTMVIGSTNKVLAIKVGALIETDTAQFTTTFDK